MIDRFVIHGFSSALSASQLTVCSCFCFSKCSADGTFSLHYPQHLTPFLRPDAPSSLRLSPSSILRRHLSLSSSWSFGGPPRFPLFSRRTLSRPLSTGTQGQASQPASSEVHDGPDSEGGGEKSSHCLPPGIC
ncbi:Hypothetical protein NTJ_13940 [Nesidiocoris tenuis]|uniref:Uncharacterized protein n=1 Tax=Nesidiocoris tenuis TaxID=355587 RepID=A0ABN7BA34_9HEMI|nr:Hypothetical protein NTJ_13940 [Nesidiocoris tenuis]